MWVSRSELRRLLQQVSAAELRATRAEDALAAERRAKDALVVQLASRVLTKAGTYGLEEQPPAPRPPSSYMSEPTAYDYDRRDYYIKSYLEAGRSEEDALALWEAEMKGETVTYPYEQEQ